MLSPLGARGSVSGPLGVSPVSLASNSWWLSGGIAAASCIAAYAAKGAASYVASKINLANPGTYNLGDGAAYPSWIGSVGWTFNGVSQYLSVGNGGYVMKPVTLIAKISPTIEATLRTVISGALSGCATIYIGADFKLHFTKKSIAVIGVSSSDITGACCIGVSYSASGDCIFYLNGYADGNTKNNQTFSSASNLVGDYPGIYRYDGAMSSYSVYDTVLTQPQVAAVSAAMP